MVTRFDSLVSDFLRASPASGITVGIVQRSDTVLLKGYGERNRTGHLPADPSTVYRIASITKQFTAAAVMRLVERGVVRLEDPVTKHLPQYPQWSAVTVRQLLNHTSGIRSYTSLPAWRETWDHELTPARIVALVEKDALEFVPGARWSYNNTGYVLLGMIVERVTRQSYALHLQRQFFTPLGMRTAGYCPSRPTQSSHARGYTLKNDALAPADFLSMSHPHAAGALCMSVPDYLRWQSALVSGRVVNARSLALMAGPERLADGSSTNYGFGLARGSVADRPTMQHGGGINGFSTVQLWFPTDSLSIVAFVNTDNVNVDFLAGNLASVVFGRPPRPRLPPAVPLSAVDRARYEGTYDIVLPDQRLLELKLFAEGDMVMGQATGQGKSPMRYLGNHTFGADFDPSLRFVFTVVDGQVTGATLMQRGATMNVIRRP